MMTVKAEDRTWVKLDKTSTDAVLPEDLQLTSITLKKIREVIEKIKFSDGQPREFAIKTGREGTLIHFTFTKGVDYKEEVPGVRAEKKIFSVTPGLLQQIAEKMQQNREQDENAVKPRKKPKQEAFDISSILGPDEPEPRSR